MPWSCVPVSPGAAGTLWLQATQAAGAAVVSSRPQARLGLSILFPPAALLLLVMQEALPDVPAWMPQECAGPGTTRRPLRTCRRRGQAPAVHRHSREAGHPLWVLGGARL